MNGRCDFCPRNGRLASCRCPNGHADVGVWVCAEKHEPWLNSVEIACRQCDAGTWPQIVALYETPSAALVAKIERLRLIEKGVHDLLADLLDMSPTEVVKPYDLAPVVDRILTGDSPDTHTTG